MTGHPVLARVLAALALALSLLGSSAAVSVPSAHAAAAQYVGARILDRAETKVNHLYSYGSAGPAYFDCSGLVFWSAQSLGLSSWPRDTFDIAAQIGRRFVLTSHPVRGDLALWGSMSAPYHVEIMTAWDGWTFGAETYGWAGRVTWHSSTWFRPSFYLRILY